MIIEKAKRKNDDITNIDVINEYHSKLLKTLMYLATGLIGLWLAFLSIVLFIIGIEITKFMPSNWAISFVISIAVVFCVCYTVSSLSTYLLINQLNMELNLISLVIGIVVSICISGFIFISQFSIPIAIVFTIYSLVRKRSGY